MQDGPEWDYWPCGCIKRDRKGNLLSIKENHRSVRQCKDCGAERPEFVRPSRKAGQR